MNNLELYLTYGADKELSTNNNHDRRASGDEHPYAYDANAEVQSRDKKKQFLEKKFSNVGMNKSHSYHQNDDTYHDNNVYHDDSVVHDGSDYNNHAKKRYHNHHESNYHDDHRVQQKKYNNNNNNNNYMKHDKHDGDDYHHHHHHHHHDNDNNSNMRYDGRVGDDNDDHDVENNERRDDELMQQFSVQPSGNIFSDIVIKDYDKLHKGLKKNLTEHMGFEKLTGIQERCFEAINGGNDVLISSETGSGKTLAYLVPSLQRLVDYTFKNGKIERDNGTHIVILSPTKELCIQIHKILVKLCTPYPWCTPGILTGLENPKKEKAKLRKGVTVLVATPGRLNYHLRSTQSFNVENLMTIIMDEADGIMDLGDEKQLREIFSSLGSKLKVTQKPQTILVSATLNSNIRKLASFTLKNEIIISAKDFDSKDIQSDQEVFHIPKTLLQFYVVGPRYLFIPLLIAFLRSKTSSVSLKLTKNAKPSKILVFFSTADSVQFYYLLFQKTNIFRHESEKGLPFEVPIFKLHSAMDASQRSKAYFDFCNASSGILLCTDVAARGLDFADVDWIVQYDPAEQPKEYLHRIGRTARLGKSGNALIFLAENELLYVKLLESYNLTLSKLNGMQLFEHLNLGFGNDVSRSPIAACNHLLDIVSTFVSKNKEIYQWACAAFLSFIRAYTSHFKDTRYIFHAKNLRLDHVKRMFGLKEKGKILLKHNPKVGRIKEKLKEKFKRTEITKETSDQSNFKEQFARSDLEDDIDSDMDDEDIPNDNDASGFYFDKTPSNNVFDADEEIIESGDDETDEELSDDEGKKKDKRKLVDIREELEKYRMALEQPTRRLPPVKLDSSLIPEHVKRQQQLSATIVKKEVADSRTPMGQVMSTSLKAKLEGKTKEGSSKDVRKKAKFQKKMRDAVELKGRTSDAKKMAERNPFDIRGRGTIAKIMNSVSSEFDSAVKSRGPQTKRQRLMY